MYNDELTHYAIAKSRDSQYAVAYDDEYLEHYGKKGMKWGVRNDPQRVGRKPSRKGLSKGAKIAIGVGAGVLGTATVGVLGAKYGPGAVNALGTVAKTTARNIQATSRAKQINIQKTRSVKTSTKKAKQFLLSKEGNVERLAKIRANKAAKAAAEKKLRKETLKALAKDSRKEAGEEFVKQTIKGMGGIASKAVLGGIAITGKTAVNKMISSESASYTFPNPNKKK